MDCNNNECSICLENIDKKHITLEKCGHKFHKKCLFKWLHIKPFCPYCRASICIDFNVYILKKYFVFYKKENFKLKILKEEFLLTDENKTIKVIFIHINSLYLYKNKIRIKLYGDKNNYIDIFLKEKNNLKILFNLIKENIPSISYEVY
jgi:hypothetical protein